MRRVVVLLLALSGGCAHGIASDSRPAAQAAPPPASPPAAVAALDKAYGRIPVHFEANHGQAPADARFVGRTATGQVTLAPDGLVVGVKGTPVRLSFAGGSAAPAMEALDPLPGRIHYYRGPDPEDWRTDVPTFARVRYASVYPGIDVVVYGNQRQLEYDFVVAPGADPARIRLAVTGVTDLTVDADGDLRLVTPRGTLLQRKPVIYQDVDGLRVPIDGDYVVRKSGEVGIRVAAYDRTRPLVIDPVITYSTYLGSSGGTDVVNAIAVDSAGNAYVVGTTIGSSPELATEPFPWQNGIPSPGNGSGAFVAKLGPTGSTLIFASYIGSNTVPWAVALDGSGNIYVGGSTSSTTFPATPGAFQSSAPSGSNGFVLKLNPAGDAIAWATYLGGAGTDVVNSLAVDAGGAVYAAGTTSSTAFPVTSGAPQTTFGGGTSDAFVAKLAADGGSLLYASYLGGGGADQAKGLALDTANQVYVTGTATAGFPTTAGAFKTTLPGSDASDAFVAKLGASGSVLYSTLAGGGANDIGNAIDIDASGNAYVAGRTTSTDFPLVNAWATTGSPAGTAFVFKLNAAGTSLVYSTYLSQTDNAVGIGVDASGAAYVVSHTEVELFNQVNPIITPLCDAIEDCVVATKLNAAGQVTPNEYHVIVGGGGANARGLALDAAGSVFIAGTADHGYTTTPGAYDTTHGQDDNDGFITKLSAGTSGGGVGGGGDTTPPTVSITSPPGNVWTGNSLGFSVTASDNVGLVSIKLWGNGAVFATVNCSGTTCSGNTGWLTGPLPPAAYQVHAVALDTAGNQTLSTPVTIFKDATSPLVPSGASGSTGGGGTTPPPLGAAITSPANGATVSGAGVGVTMTASNAQGTPISFVLKVDNGATIFSGSGSASTTTTSWNTTGLSNGVHTLNLTVTDGAGRTAPATISVTVNNPTGGGGGGGDTTPPTVSITSPPGNVWTGNSLGFSVTASDNAGLVSIKLWGNGAVFATVNCSGTTCSGNTGWLTGPLPPAAYEVHAVALDTAGNQALSSPVTIFKDATSPLVPSGASGSTGGGGTTPPPPLGAAITSPANGATVSGAAVPVSMSASNAQGSSTSFTLSVDSGTPIFSQTVAGSTASTTWNTTGLTNGAHTLNLTVTDGAGRTATAAITVTVSNPTGGGGGDTTAPTVAITNPPSGAWTGNSLDITVSGTDNVGLTNIQVFGNGALVETLECGGTATCSGVVWWFTGPLPSGQHTVSAVSTDTAGNKSSTASIIINK